MTYADKIFESFKSQFPSSPLTKKSWLDGPKGWRVPLRRIGELARQVEQIEDNATARRMWLSRLRVHVWMRDYLIAVPLLDDTATRADRNPATFRRFMADLATLTEL